MEGGGVCLGECGHEDEDEKQRILGILLLNDDLEPPVWSLSDGKCTCWSLNAASGETREKEQTGGEHNVGHFYHQNVQDPVSSAERSC